MDINCNFLNVYIVHRYLPERREAAEEIESDDDDSNGDDDGHSREYRQASGYHEYVTNRKRTYPMEQAKMSYNDSVTELKRLQMVSGHKDSGMFSTGKVSSAFLVTPSNPALNIDELHDAKSIVRTGPINGYEKQVTYLAEASEIPSFCPNEAHHQMAHLKVSQTGELEQFLKTWDVSTFESKFTTMQAPLTEHEPSLKLSLLSSESLNCSSYVPNGASEDSSNSMTESETPKASSMVGHENVSEENTAPEFLSVRHENVSEEGRVPEDASAVEHENINEESSMPEALSVRHENVGESCEQPASGDNRSVRNQVLDATQAMRGLHLL